MKNFLLLIIFCSLTMLSNDSVAKLNTVISNESSSEKSLEIYWGRISPFGRNDTTDSSAIDQKDKNKIIKDENSEPMLIGYCTREAFTDSAFALWFNPAYEDYEPDSSAIEILKEKMKDVDITIVMGTWCDDSRIHVPHLYKILDEINYPTEDIILIAVDEEKKTEGDEIEGLAIDLVPTIIFFINDSEMGRIVEAPAQSIEEDILGIVSVYE